MHTTPQTAASLAVALAFGASTCSQTPGKPEEHLALEFSDDRTRPGRGAGVRTAVSRRARGRTTYQRHLAAAVGTPAGATAGKAGPARRRNRDVQTTAGTGSTAVEDVGSVVGDVPDALAVRWRGAPGDGGGEAGRPQYSQETRKDDRQLHDLNSLEDWFSGRWKVVLLLCARAPSGGGTSCRD